MRSSTVCSYSTSRAWQFSGERIDRSTEMLHIFLSNRVGHVEYGTTGTPVPGYAV
jgi:hypothetical protein